MIKRAQFEDVELVAGAAFSSSPKTKGALLRAVRPVVSYRGTDTAMIEDALGRYREFFDLAYADGALDRKTKHLIALGASLGAGCEP